MCAGPVPATATGAAPPATNLTEPAALLKLKAAIDPDVMRLISWREVDGDTHCKWEGVVCNAAGSVVGLTFKGCDAADCNEALTGTLPTYGEVFHGLPALRKVSIPSNKLTGTLPADWWQLPLKEILLPYNELSGSLPPEWSKLAKSLEKLDLGFNKLDGPLPASWGALAKLQFLWIGGNTFRGTLPPEWGGMVSVQRLWLGPNRKISGTVPDSYACWTKFNSYALYQTGLTGCLPRAWYSSTVQAFSSNDTAPKWEGTTITNCRS